MKTRLLTVRQTAEVLGVSIGTVYNLINRGELQSLKLGRSRKIAPEAIDALVAKLQEAQKAQPGRRSA